MIALAMSIASAIALGALIGLAIASITYARVILEWLCPRPMARDLSGTFCDDRPLPPSDPALITSRNIVTALRRNGGC